jgi:hypothetical protein
MDTTVTGMFPSQSAAALAAARLVAAGFRSDQIRVVDADSRDRHRMIDETTSGVVLGLVVGRSTKSQVQDELEHQVEAGAVLVNVVTDDARTAIALRLLAEAGGTSVVSTAASFTAAGVPSTPEA